MIDLWVAEKFSNEENRKLHHIIYEVQSQNGTSLKLIITCLLSMYTFVNPKPLPHLNCSVNAKPRQGGDTSIFLPIFNNFTDTN